MNIFDKYNANRHLIKNGDLILFRGNHIMAKAIQYFDSAYYNHIGIVMECNGRLFIIDSNADGVEPEFLSTRMKKYVDFSILEINKPQNEIDLALYKILAKAEYHIKYDFMLALRIVISRKFGYDLKFLGDSDRVICSDWARRLTNAVGLKCYNFNHWITPQDFKRFQDPLEIITILP